MHNNNMIATKGETLDTGKDGGCAGKRSRELDEKEVHDLEYAAYM